MTVQLSAKDKVSYYHDWQDKVRGHWGISATVPPEASAIQATPTSFVSVSKWTRIHTNKLLFDAGLAIYDQEYTENYQPDVFAGTVPAGDDLRQQHATRTPARWNNPADHFSKLFTEQFASQLRHRRALAAGRRHHQPGAMASDAGLHARRPAGHLQQRRAGVGDVAHPDRSPQLDQERQRRVRAGSVDDRARDDQRRRALGLVHQRDRSGDRSRPAPSTRRSPTARAPTARTT